MAAKKKTAAKKVTPKKTDKKNAPTEVTVAYVTPPAPIAKSLYSVDDDVKRKSTGGYGVVVGFSSKNVSDIIVEWQSNNPDISNVVDVLDVSEITAYDYEGEVLDGESDAFDYADAVRKTVVDTLKGLRGRHSADYIDGFCQTTADILATIPTSCDVLDSEED
jgi:hypothetical protein